MHTTVSHSQGNPCRTYSVLCSVFLFVHVLHNTTLCLCERGENACEIMYNWVHTCIYAYTICASVPYTETPTITSHERGFWVAARRAYSSDNPPQNPMHPYSSSRISAPQQGRGVGNVPACFFPGIFRGGQRQHEPGDSEPGDSDHNPRGGHRPGHHRRRVRLQLRQSIPTRPNCDQRWRTSLEACA